MCKNTTQILRRDPFILIFLAVFSIYWHCSYLYTQKLVTDRFLFQLTVGIFSDDFLYGEKEHGQLS